jgi:hypothetical protein
MSEFHSLLAVQKLAAKKWQLTQDLVFESDALARTIVVPAGFVTDFASVPRLPLAFLFLGDRAHEAAVVHDYLYAFGHAMGVTKDMADKVFLEAMEETSAESLLNKLEYAGPALFGGRFYQSPAKDKADEHVQTEGPAGRSPG